MRHPKTSSRASSVPKKCDPMPHRGQAVLEVQVGAVSDIAILGLVDDWMVPMIVDRIIESMMEGNAGADRLRPINYCEYNNLSRTAHDEKEPKGRSATQASSVEA